MSLLVRDRASADVTTASAGPAGPVRVNLLPPEIMERARLRRIQVGLGAGLVGVVAVIAAVHVGAAGSVEQAEDDLAALTAEQADLQSRTREFDGVEGAYARTAAARQTLEQAMGQEVRYSQLLDELSLTVPDRVWLTEVSVAQSGPTSAQPSAGQGTVTFTGAGTSHDDVAAWLDSLSRHDELADATFSSSTASTEGSRRTVTFTSTATLTSAALSGRHTVEAG